MKRSKVDTAATRRTIVAEASRLFVENGVAATGVNDVMSAVGLTVGGFYRHFDSKDQLLAEATQSAFTRLFDRIEAEAADLEPAAAIRMIADGYLAQARGESTCPLGNLGSELKRCHPDVRAATLEGHKRFVRLVTKVLKSMDVPDASAKITASGMVSTLVGAVSLAQISPDPAATRAVVKNAQRAIDAQLAAALRS